MDCTISNEFEDIVIGDVDTINAQIKYRLAEAQISKRAYGAQLARQHSLDRKRVSNYARIVRYGGILRQTGGRPPLLDEISISALVQKLRDNSTTSYRDCKRLMVEEMIVSNRRLSPFYIRPDKMPPTKVSKASYYRYMTIIRARLQGE